MKKLVLFAGQELMSMASVAKCKFNYVPIPIAAMGSGDYARHIKKTKAKVFDQDAINAAENEGWPIFFDACRDKIGSSLKKEEAVSNSTPSRVKSAFEKFKEYLCGVKKRSPENDSQTIYTPKEKDEKTGFSRPPYID